LKSKKGTIQDMFFVIVIILLTMIGMVVGIKIFNSLRNTPIFTESPQAQEIQNKADILNSAWDGIFVFLIIIALLVPIVAAFILGNNPVFIWAVVLLSIFVVLFGAIVNNVYDDIINQPDMSDVKVLLPMTTFVFDNFGLVMTGFIGMLILALFFGTRAGE
jgi:magnesium-transporting ATPase (P-type)